MPSVHHAVEADTSAKKASSPKARLSFKVVKAIITVALIVGLVMVVIQLYYPGVFPWNN
jgi:hypothetical protein